jgi:predicted DsbA family dithiol-disulfide isomerase
MAESAVPAVHVDVVSDVVCPWCYIGKRRLEMAVALTPEIAVEVNWRPYFAATAAIEGLPFAIDKISRQPNTLDCHRLILWSRSATDPGEMKQRLMELYFAEGADLSDPKTLIRAAVDCGMDGDLVRRLLASDADVDRVENEANGAKEAGIDGVPCFIFGGIVTGAQSPEYLANAIQRIAGQHTRLQA